MAIKRLSNRDILDDLIKKIKEIQEITQGRISTLAGYDTENYIAEAKSNDNITDNMIEKVKGLYERALQNPDILKKGKNPDNKESLPLYSMAELKRKIDEQWQVIRSQQKTIQDLAGKIRPDIGDPPAISNVKNA